MLENLRAPEHDDQTADPTAAQAAPGGAHDSDDLLNAWRVGRVAHALVPRRTPAVELRKVAGDRRRPATSKLDIVSSSVEQ
jgi:hypothetical protein